MLTILNAGQLGMRPASLRPAARHDDWKFENQLVITATLSSLFDFHEERDFRVIAEVKQVSGLPLNAFEQAWLVALANTPHRSRNSRKPLSEEWQQRPTTKCAVA